jgi:hypothetical protein
MGSLSETIDTQLSLRDIVDRFERASKKPLLGGWLGKWFTKPNFELFTPQPSPTELPTETPPDFSIGCQYRMSLDTHSTMQMHVWDHESHRQVDLVSIDGNPRMLDRYVGEFK